MKTNKRKTKADISVEGRKIRAFSSLRLHSPISFALVIALHATAIYALGHNESATAPSTSVPLIVSLAATSEQVQPTPPKPQVKKPRPAPTKAPSATKAAEVAPEATPPSTPENAPPAPAQVVPARFDAAYLNNPTPSYPLIARRMGEEGKVLLRVFVNPDGTPHEVSVSTSSGSQRLDNAAKEAVERWKFAPARQGDRAIGAWVVVPVTFTLSQQG